MRLPAATRAVRLGACLTLLLAAVACGSFAETPGGSGGNGDGDGGPDGSALPCDPKAGPKDSPRCIADDTAVFVSAAGDDGAAGNKAAPVKSIARGVELATTRGLSRVYVCEGNYGGNVELVAAVSLYGGLSCAWSYTGARPRLAPSKGIALRVAHVDGVVVVEDFDIVGSADASAPGESAIGAFVSDSTNVTFRRTDLAAGAASGGKKGGAASNHGSAEATVGGNASGATRGTGPTCTCPDGTTSRGGDGADGTGAGLSDGTASPAVGDPNAGSTGTATCTNGTPGANGEPKGAGAAMTSAGALSASGWDSTATPPNAPNGSPAQGGGGGGAKTTANAAGGGGGCGGCGGAGGTPGTNAGSSFALLSFGSSVTIEGGVLASGAGGPGGEGGAGQPGQAGGGLGVGACNGGPGGNGAGGSGGGGGAGGHSVPVAFVGTEPHALGATLTPGAKGAGGQGGQPGSGPGKQGTAGTVGADGKSQNTLAL